jgi:hypothetical protein
MKYVFDRSFKFKVNEDEWQGYLITEDEAKELDEKFNDVDIGFGALTLTKDDGRCLFVVEGHVTKNIIVHELFHIYVSYFCLGSTDVSLDDFEEIIAEFLELHLTKFIKKSNSLYKKFKKLEDSGRKK